MGNLAAVIGVALLVAGIVLLALLGNRRSFAWAPYAGVGLVVLGMGVEVAGAVAAAA